MAVENLNATATSIIYFLIGLAVSTVVIYVVTLFMRQRRSLKLALFTAIIGSIVYVIAYALFGNGFLSAVLGGVAWLLALKGIYRMGWLKALIVAVGIWIITTIIGAILPTAIGPL
jgi:predicted neutral ceramidase superfamily lipid hydrolase